MIDWARILRSAFDAGNCAKFGSAAALAVAVRAEGKAAVRPIKVTSHWRNGEAAGLYKGFDGAHIVVGFLTNHVASIFWAVFFEAWHARWRLVSPIRMLQDALFMSAVAAAVDYDVTLTRSTLGWELVLSKKDMAVAYGGLAIALAAGGLLMQSARAVELTRPAIGSRRPRIWRRVGASRWSPFRTERYTVDACNGRKPKGQHPAGVGRLQTGGFRGGGRDKLPYNQLPAGCGSRPTN